MMYDLLLGLRDVGCEFWSGLYAPDGLVVRFAGTREQCAGFYDGLVAAAGRVAANTPARGYRVGEPNVFGLVGDLGGNDWIQATTTDEQRLRRAVLTFTMLHSMSAFVLDTLVEEGDVVKGDYAALSKAYHMLYFASGHKASIGVSTGAALPPQMIRLHPFVSVDPAASVYGHKGIGGAIQGINPVRGHVLRTPL
jgi:hypothetical protein